MRLLFQNRQTLLPSFLLPPPSKTVAVGYFYSKRHLVQAKQLSESCRQDDDDASLRWPFVIIIFLFFVYRRTVTQLRPRLNVLLLFNFRFKKRMAKTYRAVCCWKKKLNKRLFWRCIGARANCQKDQHLQVRIEKDL